MPETPARPLPRERRFRVPVESQTASKATTCEIKRVVDKPRGAINAIFHIGENGPALVTDLLAALQNANTRRYRGQRVAEIMAQHGNELPLERAAPCSGSNYGYPSSPILRAAINASCGMLTEPYSRILFFPSFCFSSSLRGASPP